MTRTVAVLLHAPSGSSALERFVEGGRRASAEDLIRALRPAVDELLVVTDAPSWQASLDSLDATVIPPRHPFRFGDTFSRLVREHGIDVLLYFGSGSGGLLGTESIDELLAFAGQDGPGALFNNYYSCDFAVVREARSLLKIDLPPNDNGLGFALSDAGVPCHALQRSLETEFDVDTPTDLILLDASGRGGPTMRAFLDKHHLEHPTLDAVCDQLTDHTRTVHLSGRINPAVWAAFVPQVACRTAGVTEGRGMRAYRDHRPLLLQRLLREDGPVAFFERLAETADAAILDTRPMLAVRGVLPPPADRFASDLFLADRIADPNWRRFTEAAATAPIPVLLGGHSLVAGGLRLLADACWKGRSLARRLHPDPFKGRDPRP